MEMTDYLIYLTYTLAACGVFFGVLPKDGKPLSGALYGYALLMAVLWPLFIIFKYTEERTRGDE